MGCDVGVGEACDSSAGNLFSASGSVDSVSLDVYTGDQSLLSHCQVVCDSHGLITVKWYGWLFVSGFAVRSGGEVKKVKLDYKRVVYL